jgi:branched-chain amino acid transport system substrate-binding protein
MRLLLEAIRRAGPRGNDRPAVLTGLFKARLSGGPLGAFGIDRWGDATRSGYGIDRVRGGCPVRVRTLVLAHVASGAGA